MVDYEEWFAAFLYIALVAVILVVIGREFPNAFSDTISMVIIAAIALTVPTGIKLIYDSLDE